MGYLTCSQEWAAQNGQPDAWRDWWDNPEAVHYYVHGKDNIPFHTIIWPAMLMALGLHLPDRIISSEYLQFEGIKFSKSLGIGVWLPNALAQFEPDAIRFFLTLHGPETSDTTFSWEEFRARVNGDLIGTLGNFWNRVFTQIHRNWGMVPKYEAVAPESQELRQQAKETFGVIGTRIERGEFRQALRTVLSLAQQGNRYLEVRAPWTRFRQDPSHAAETLGVCMEVGDALRRLANPFIPHTVGRLNDFLDTNDLAWQWNPLPAGKTVPSPKPLIPPIPEEAIQAELEKLAIGKQEET